MPFRFKPSDETVEAGFRRIACEALDGALDLVHAGSQPPERTVHEVRRTCKAMRGLLRLVRPAFPAYRTENNAFRDLAASFSRARDSKVLVQTLDSLLEGQKDEPAFAALRARWIAEGEAAGEESAAQLEACVAPLLAARVRAQTWMLTAHGEQALLPGLRKTYRRARHAKRALEASDDTPAAALASHEWRKQVKYHWQHMRLMRSLVPAMSKARVAKIERLGELLGDRHDIDVLLARLGSDAAHISDPQAASHLAALAHKRAAALMRKAERRGEALFADKPSAFEARWRFGTKLR